MDSTICRSQGGGCVSPEKKEELLLTEGIRKGPQRSYCLGFGPAETGKGTPGGRTGQEMGSLVGTLGSDL